MLRFRYYLEKSGGFGLVVRYLRLGVLSSAISELFVLGVSKTGLELFRKVMDEKITQKLARKHGKVLNEMNKRNISSLDHTHNHTIWILWWQGMNNAPLLVKRCFESVKYWLGDWNIVLLDKSNYSKYAELPDYVIDKFHRGIIPMAQFSDLVRLSILINRGGLWLDSTVFVSGSKLPPLFYGKRICSVIQILQKTDEFASLIG